jgi:hypothetical protein
LSAPTLDQLRRRVFKHSPTPERPDDAPSPEVGNWLARRVGRPSAVYGTWLAIRLGLTANQVTTLALAASLAAAIAFGDGRRSGFLAGVLLAQLAYWLDHVDGQVARWRRAGRVGGIYFDFMMHHAANLALGFGLGFGLALRTGVPAWSVAGMLAGSGWLFLGLHNDCRYKALFARLKDERRPLRVRFAERPAPPARWPRSGPGLLAWPLQKACEPHLVLLTLTALGASAVLAPAIWASATPAYVAGMAILAPGLALARGAKCVVLDAPGAEYDRWFEALDEPAA